MKRRRKSKNFVPFRKKLCNNQVVRIVRHFSKRFSNSYFSAPPCNTIKTHKSLHVNETMATRPYNIRKRSHTWKLLKWTKSNVWDYWLSLKPNFNYASFYIFKRSQIGTSTKFSVDPHRLRRYHPPYHYLIVKGRILLNLIDHIYPLNIIAVIGVVYLSRSSSRGLFTT